MNDLKIDFVVTWLDSTDPEWQKSLNEFSPNSNGGKDNARFRNIGIFRYWFRAIERYAPWVNKVFLITNGTFPKWINIDNPKLVLVKHSDYMPEDCLPTFNSCAIELYMHRIKGLSEHFVYFNDDFFLNAPVRPDYYFKDGLPCDLNKETCFNVPIYTKEDKFGIYMQMLADIGVINGNFNRWNTVLESPRRWFGEHIGLRGFLMSCLLAHQRLFIGFSNYHTEQSYLKSIFNEVWQAAPEFMKASCSRFREDVSANPYIFRYWQFARNMFFPMKRSAMYFPLYKNKLNSIEKAILEEKCISICLNDHALCSEEDFCILKAKLQQLFAKKYPQKSSYEI